MQQAGKLIVIAGIVIVIIGLVLWSGGGKYFKWLGHLPGDINIQRDNVRIYIPIATMLLLSVILSVVMWIFRKFF